MLKNRLAQLFIASLGAALLAPLGCGDMTQEMPPDMAEEKPRCALPYDVRAIDKVSTGAVDITVSPTDAAVYNAQIDATAGGSMGYGENPFVYIDLIGRKKVALSDAKAQFSTDWDIAFKRWQIKINGGDSGPGYVLLTRVDGTSLGDVMDVPLGPYSVDSYFDAQCNLISDPIGGLGTALSDWYDYDMTMGTRLVPRPQILVFTRRDGQGYIKLQITSYYKDNTSGYFSVSWSYFQ